jgi:hypothetical protein
MDPRFFFLSVFCFLSIGSLTAQTDYRPVLAGTWMVMESLASAEIEAPELSPYTRYEFLPNDSLYVGTNEYERGIKARYWLKDKTLFMFGGAYTIEKYGDGVIELLQRARWNAPQQKLTLVSKQIYDAQWRFIRPTSGSAPIFNAGFPLFEYVFSHYVKSIRDFEKQTLDRRYEPEPHPPINDKLIKVSATIDSVGNITVHEIAGSPRLGKLRTKRIKQKLESTSGMWIPAVVDGRPTTQKVSMNFVRRGNYSLKFRNRALAHFRRSYGSMQKEDYPLAIRQVTEAISLVDDRFQFYVLRAVCHLRMGNIEKYCADVRKAHQLNPFVSRRNVELVEGRMLEINCGE